MEGNLNQKLSKLIALYPNHYKYSAYEYETNTLYYMLSPTELSSGTVEIENCIYYSSGDVYYTGGSFSLNLWDMAIDTGRAMGWGGAGENFSEDQAKTLMLQALEDLPGSNLYKGYANWDAHEDWAGAPLYWVALPSDGNNLSKRAFCIQPAAGSAVNNWAFNQVDLHYQD